MITSKYIIELLEDWSKSAKVRGESVDIYENPGSTDIKEILKSVKGKSSNLVRFIADAKPPQKVYVVAGYYAIHDDMRKALGRGSINSEWKKIPYIIGGEGHIVNGQIILSPPEKYSEGESIDRLTDMISFLGQLGPKSITNSKDFIDINKPFIESIFSYDWSFVDKYISGFKEFLDSEKKEFSNFVKKL